MPFSKDPSTYPEEIKQIFLTAIQAEDSIEIPMPDKQTATNMRHKMHAYRRAVINSRSIGYEDYHKLQIKIIGEATNDIKIKIQKDEGIEALSSVLSSIALSGIEVSESSIEEYLKQLDSVEEQTNEEG